MIMIRKLIKRNVDVSNLTLTQYIVAIKKIKLRTFKA